MRSRRQLVGELVSCPSTTARVSPTIRCKLCSARISEQCVCERVCVRECVCERERARESKASRLLPLYHQPGFALHENADCVFCHMKLIYSIHGIAWYGGRGQLTLLMVQ